MTNELSTLKKQLAKNPNVKEIERLTKNKKISKLEIQLQKSTPLFKRHEK